MHYVFGLGNLGNEHQHTRHNAGRVLVAAVAKAAGSPLSFDRQANASMGMGDVGGAVTFVLPETYMNLSGQTARYFVEKHTARPEDFIVVYDDVDLPLGTMRLSIDRGDGGHNGIKSIEAALGSRAFARIRIGIAPTSFLTGKVKRPKGGGALERFVLGTLTRRERAAIEALLPRVTEAIETITKDGIEKAMSTTH
jgi:PTH1 family peptidyl-tRNA hydrolase